MSSLYWHQRRVGAAGRWLMRAIHNALRATPPDHAIVAQACDAFVGLAKAMGDNDGIEHWEQQANKARAYAAEQHQNRNED